MITVDQHRAFYYFKTKNAGPASSYTSPALLY